MKIAQLLFLNKHLEESKMDVHKRYWGPFQPHNVVGKVLALTEAHSQ